MKSAAALNYELRDMPEKAAQVEAMGADIIATGEFAHDPLMMMAMAATGTTRAQLMSGIVVAFGRSPMTVAVQAHDVNCLSEGRFILGVGSQIKPHIERRYSMPWSKPAARMREYVLAIKAIWANWYEGIPLDFQGEFYTHTLMTPMFTPADKRFGAPPIYVAAVGPLMTTNAAEVADGILLHSFVTEEFLREVTLPAVNAGLEKAGRSREDVKISGGPFIVTADSEEEFEKVKLAVRNQIAFYASTPAYKPVLDSIGYGDLQLELLKLSKQDKWKEMGQLVDEPLLNKLALVGEPKQVSTELNKRFGDIFDVCSLSVMGGEAYSEMLFSREIAEALKDA